MVAALIQTYFFIQRAQFAIDARANESVAGQFSELFFEFSLAAPNNGSQNHHALAAGQGQHILQNLIDTLTRDRRPALITMRQTNRGEKEAQIIINLRNLADSRTRTARDGLLLNRDGGTQTFD